jgi:predicted nucleic acid-binding Zn ribbon protein
MQDHIHWYFLTWPRFPGLMQRRIRSVVHPLADATHIGGILSDVLQRYRPETGQGMLRVWRVWERTVGEEIARNAQPAAFKGSLLLVHVSSSAWLHHLRFMKKDIVASLNHDIGHALVSDIKFKIGSF